MDNLKKTLVLFLSGSLLICFLLYRTGMLTEESVNEDTSGNHQQMLLASNSLAFTNMDSIVPDSARLSLIPPGGRERKPKIDFNAPPPVESRVYLYSSKSAFVPSNLQAIPRLSFFWKRKSNTVLLRSADSTRLLTVSHDSSGLILKHR